MRLLHTHPITVTYTLIVASVAWGAWVIQGVM